MREVDENEAAVVANGRPLAGEAEGPVRVSRGTRLLALYGPAAESGLLKPLVVLP